MVLFFLFLKIVCLLHLRLVFFLFFFVFCQAHLCGAFIQKHASIHSNVPFNLFHTPLHHCRSTKHFCSSFSELNLYGKACCVFVTGQQHHILRAATVHNYKVMQCNKWAQWNFHGGCSLRTLWTMKWVYSVVKICPPPVAWLTGQSAANTGHKAHSYHAGEE